MKVLMISGDPQVLVMDSPAEKRTEEYRTVLGDLDVLLCRGGILSFILGFFKGSKMIKGKRPDVIIAQDMEHSFLAWIFSKIYKIPWQMQVHTDIFSSYFYAQSFKNKIRVFLAKFLLPKADGVRVVSERIKSSLTAYGIRHTAITVLSIFVDMEHIKNTPVRTDLHLERPGQFIILMASRITREKNIALAINAVKDLKATLLIVGDGPEVGNLKGMASGNVSFEPHTDDMVSYYKTCDLFLLTSNYEGYGMTLVEADAAGAKIISSDVGIAGEVLEPENIFKVGDLQELKNKLEVAIGGNIKPAKALYVQTKEEYLGLYKESLEKCLK